MKTTRYAKTAGQHGTSGAVQAGRIPGLMNSVASADFSPSGEIIAQGFGFTWNFLNWQMTIFQREDGAFQGQAE